MLRDSASAMGYFHRTRIPNHLTPSPSYKSEILFIDARNMGAMIDRRHRELTADEIKKISGTYHSWRSKNGKYSDIAGFCKSAKIDEVKKHGYILTPGWYVGAEAQEEDSEV